MSKFNINFEDLKNQFINKIFLSMKDEIPETAQEQLDQFFIKYIGYFREFSLKNHESILPELLGHAMLCGFSIGKLSSNLKLAIDDLIQKWMEELNEEKYKGMYS